MRPSSQVMMCCGLARSAGIGLATLPLRAQGGDAPAVEQRVATVDTIRLLRWSMQSPASIAERNTLSETIRARLGAIEQQWTALNTANGSLPAGDPQIEVNNQQMQALAQQYSDVQQSSESAMDQLQANQVKAVYERIVKASHDMAASLGYSHVLSSPLTVETDSFANTAVAMQSLVGRPVLVAPEGDDLTLRIAAALNIEEPKPVVESPTSGPDGPVHDAGGSPAPSSGDAPAGGQPPSDPPAGGAGSPPPARR